MLENQLIKTIQEIARIPSFTGYEYRLHDYIQDFCNDLRLIPELVPDNNILIETPGEGAPIALSAHLDKNNYWGAEYPQSIPAVHAETKLTGLLDDAVGLGLCLEILKESADREFPPLQILLSECEETSGDGANELAKHLIKTDKTPAALVVIDVTPKFAGAPGLALYSAPWEILPWHRGAGRPDKELRQKIEKFAKEFHQLCPRLDAYNNYNDYAVYGQAFNKHQRPVPCFALEPSVDNYHSADEAVWVHDIIETKNILTQFLENRREDYLNDTPH